MEGKAGVRGQDLGAFDQALAQVGLLGGQGVHQVEGLQEGEVAPEGGGGKPQGAGKLGPVEELGRPRGQEGVEPGQLPKPLHLAQLPHLAGQEGGQVVPEPGPAPLWGEEDGLGVAPPE